MNPTIAEQNVINFLNRNHIKYCFQKPILITKKRGYIVDFIIYIADEKRFVLEIDGSSHRGNENNDKKRTEELKKKGYIVRRMSNYNTDKERIERVFSNIAMPIVLSKK